MHPSLYQDLTPTQAFTLHRQMQYNIRLQPISKSLRFIAGASTYCIHHEGKIKANIFLYKYSTLEIIGRVSAECHTKFPYIPGLLSFREVPALLSAWKMVAIKPDVVILSGQGIAHQERMGIATHFGQLVDIPTIGCAKNAVRAGFEHKEPANELFAQTPIFDGYGQAGFALRSKINCIPIYISPGHKITIAQSVSITKHCIRGYRMPEPIRQTRYR